AARAFRPEATPDDFREAAMKKAAGGKGETPAAVGPQKERRSVIMSNSQADGKLYSDWLLEDLRAALLSVARAHGIEIDLLNSECIPALQIRISELQELQTDELTSAAIYFMKVIIRELAN